MKQKDYYQKANDEILPSEELKHRTIAQMNAASQPKDGKKIWKGVVASILILSLFFPSVYFLSRFRGGDRATATTSPNPSPAPESTAAVLEKPALAVLAAPNYPRGYKNMELICDNTEYPDGSHKLLPSEIYMETVRSFLSENSAAMLQRQAITNPTENTVYSPFSLYLSLAAVAEMAEGQTREQLLNYLKASSIETLRTELKKLYSCMLINDEYDSKLLLTNMLWLNHTIPSMLNQDCLNSLAKNYYTESYQADFSLEHTAQAIADSLNKRTNQILQVTPQDISLEPSALLLLYNTIYFTSQWEIQFSANQTAPDLFHINDTKDIVCDFMNTTYSSDYWIGENFIASSLPLKSGNVILILPNEGTSPEELLNQKELITNFSNAGNAPYECYYADVIFKIPKFSIHSDLDLKKFLQEKGILDAFSPELADFSLLEEKGKSPFPIWVDNISQKAGLSINEDGVAAGAYTQVSYMGAVPPEQQVKFILDRPFLMIVTSDFPTSMPLFTAVIRNP